MTQWLLFRAGILLAMVVILTLGVTGIGSILSSSGQLLYLLDSVHGAVLYSLDVDHGLSVHLADDLFPGFPVLPSPDGQRIAFFAQPELSPPELVIANLDGTQLAHFDNLSPNDGVGWLPDSQHLILAPALVDEIAILNPMDQSRVVQNLPVIDNWLTFTVSPDGQYFAFYSIFLDDFDSLCGIYIVQWQENIGSCLSAYGLPLWSPDGSILLARATSQVILMRDWKDFERGGLVETSTSVILTELDPISQIVWSPDSRWLGVSGSATSDIFVVDVTSDAATPINLTNTPQRVETYPAWSPDSHQLAFATREGSNSEIYIMNADGTNIHRVTFNKGSETNLVWLP